MPTTWTEAGLVAHFKDISAKMPNRSFCFVLGAGASFTSGIKTAGFFVKNWLTELHVREGGDVPFEAWVASPALGIESFNPENPAASYPAVFVRRFGRDPEEGYAWLEDTMRGARPSIGYLVLARVLAETRHRIVVTTNFDNLVAEALAMSGGVHPLVVGHESLAGFASASPRRPLIAKIHRDLLLAPVNDPSGVSRLPEDWAAALRRILSQYTPIFLGYGGNDGSLMGFLTDLADRHIPGRPVWCHWYREEPGPHIVSVVEKLGGVLVPIRDFDELMMRLNEALGFGMPIERVQERADDMVQRCRTETTRVLERLRQARAPDKAMVRSSIDKTEGAVAWEMRARMTADPAERRAIYQEGLAEWPDAAELIAGLGWLMASELGQVPEAIGLIDAAVERAPAGRDSKDRALLLATSGRILGRYSARPEDARPRFEEALALAPGQVSVLRPFADFLASRDVERAEELYLRALSVSGERDAHVLCNYAVLLGDQRRDYDGALVWFEKALELEPEDPICLANTAELLLVKGDLGRAVALARTLWETSASDPARRGVAAVIAGLAARLAGSSDDEALGRLKGLLPLPRPSKFTFELVLQRLADRLSPEATLLYRTAGFVLTGAPPDMLDAAPGWAEVARIVPDAPWVAAADA
jgi:tetratricopeptide (TPR) repeat protein